MSDSLLVSNKSDLVLIILLIGLALIFVVLGCYSFRTQTEVTKLEKEVFEERRKKSGGLLTTTCGCYILAIALIVLILLESGYETSSQLFTLSIITGILGVFGLMIIGVNYLSITLMSVQAIALSIEGIEATRKMWMMWLREITGSILLMLAIILIIIFVIWPEIVFYYGVPIGLLVGAFYASLSYKLLMLSQDNKDKDQRIGTRCKELYRFTMISAICGILAAIDCFFLGLYGDKPVLRYLIVVAGLIGGAMVAALIYYINRCTKRRVKEWRKDKEITKAAGLSDTGEQKETKLTKPIYLKDKGDKIDKLVGHSLEAPIPPAFPKSGAKIDNDNVNPRNWSITLKHWMDFVNMCMETTTWANIAKVKGADNISMYDLNVFFVKPWTRGTGCSVAGLMNTTQEEVEVMISHAWGGSVKETMASLKSLMTMYLIPDHTPIFFCTLCMYQSFDEKEAEVGLSIPDQLLKNPFANIIESKPKRGMFVIHTFTFELYERLWCVHEVDECLKNKDLNKNVELFGACDTTKYSVDEMTKAANIKTKDGECSDVDKVTLTARIEANGSFDELDKVIKKVRTQLAKDLNAAYLFRRVFGIDTDKKNEETA